MSNDLAKPKKPTPEMDPRCPRALESHPENWCPLAVLRLKAMRNADHEISQEEEDKLPGCSWAVDHQMSNYCFFKFINEYAGDKPLSDVEIAALNNISVDVVKKTEKIAISKMKDTSVFKSLKELSGNEEVIKVHEDDDYTIYR